MKKFIKFILCTALLTTALSLTRFAKSGDIIGYAKYTDISAYINHYPITSYNINGNTAVVAEDLANYGFNVTWDDSTRTLTVTRSGGTTITPYGTVYKYSYKVGQNSFPIYETDIVTYVNNVPVTSFAIGGKTCVYIDSLAPYGELAWVPEQRATKLWLSGLPINDYQEIKEASIAEQLGFSCYPGSDIPLFDEVTGRKLVRVSSSYGYGSDTYWYNVSGCYSKYTYYVNLIEKDGWVQEDIDFDTETYIDKTGAFGQRPYSTTKYYVKGNLRLMLMHFTKNGSVSLRFNKRY